MRVIEPRHRHRPAPAAKPPRKRSWSVTRKAAVVAGVTFVTLASLAWWIDLKPDRSLVDVITRREAASQVAAEPEKRIQTFSATAFYDLYSTFAYPNTQEIQVPPAITSNPEADKRIREIAEKRGYKLRSVPVAPINKTNEKNLEGDDLLQPLALAGWQDLKARAAADGQPLRLLSGYRSIEYQRQLFIDRLLAAGAYTADIANGLADAKVENVLSNAAPPGYSRHHTGYTIDLACYPNGAFVAFKDSPCFSWIKANNYQIAKETGWIPSYPEGADQQGPEPEPWEYVWVGQDAVKD